MDTRFDITFDKVARAAEIYFVDKAKTYRRYWTAYQRMNRRALRDRLLGRPDRESLDGVIRFLNIWRCRLSYETFRPVLSNAFTENFNQLSSIADDYLESAYLEHAKMETVQSVFQKFRMKPKMGPTVASKVLALLNPNLFVMWDEPIRKAYKYDTANPNYSAFCVEMGEAAQNVASTCGSGNPTQELAARYGIRFGGPFPLSTLINYYLWLTFTRQEQI